MTSEDGEGMGIGRVSFEGAAMGAGTWTGGATGFAGSEGGLGPADSLILNFGGAAGAGVGAGCERVGTET